MQTNPRANDGLPPKTVPAACLKAKPSEAPVLRFSPTAWAKLLYLRDVGDTEVGGFGITAADDLLFVEDVELVRQVLYAGLRGLRRPGRGRLLRPAGGPRRGCEQFGRIWVHTHPGNCPQPSSVDEETFARVFGRTDWAVMFILARGGQSYARLRFHVGPGGDS